MGRTKASGTDRLGVESFGFGQLVSNELREREHCLSERKLGSPSLETRGRELLLFLKLF